MGKILENTKGLKSVQNNADQKLSKVKKEFLLEGLDCANCALKIENKIGKLVGVSSASINFANKTFKMDIEDVNRVSELIAASKQIINNIEPDVIVKDNSVSTLTRKVILLEGLCCASCAAKIENETQKLSGIENATVDFVSKKLILDIKYLSNYDTIVENIQKIVERIEPDVKVILENSHKAKKANNEEKEDNRKELIQLGVGATFFAVATVFKFNIAVELILYLISYFLVGGKVVLRAAKNISRGQIFDENFLMALATIGAFSIGEFPEGVAVMLFYQIGELFQDIAVNRSRRSIAALMDIRPDFANLKVLDELKKVSPEEVSIGDIIVVKPGEKIPLDGVIIEGTSTLDTSALTGESVPREVLVGDQVLSGAINKNGLLTIEVKKIFGESTVAKILDLVENASTKKAPTENFITKFARYYTPIVVLSAVALAFLPPLFIEGATFSQWIYRALVFLVVSCPCALVISIPLGFFGGIGGASKNGILVKGGNYLEALNKVEIVVFDKTGTLTKGVFKVTEIFRSGNLSEEDMLEYAAYAESFSNHPIATSILKAYGKVINQDEILDYNEISGYGIKVKVRGSTILAGNTKLMDKEDIEYAKVHKAGTMVHIAVNKQYLGYIVISDEVKEDSARAIRELKSIGIKSIIMLTGDNRLVAENIGKELNLDKIFYELLPHEKVEKLEELHKQKSSKGKLIFVGDGINDAPVLARADIGIAMGGVGSDAAIEAADIVIMNDEPSKIVTAIKIARKTKVIVMQNIIFALGVKAVILLLGTLGYATMWEAVFGDVGVAVIAVLNSMRAMKVNKI